MAVYERTFKAYAGDLTPERSRLLVLPRYAWKQVMASKLLLALLILMAVVTFIGGLIIYLPHNAKLLERMPFAAEAFQAIKLTARSFKIFFQVSTGIAFLMAVLTGPTLISADLRNNGLPLYFARPLTRWEYVLGKSMVMVLLLSLVSWVPTMLLFAIQCSLAGTEWVKEYWYAGPAVFISSWIWIGLLTLVSLALSAYIRHKALAMAGLFGVFIISRGVAAFINLTFGTVWGTFFSPWGSASVLWSRLFRTWDPSDFPVLGALLSLVTLVALCVWLLSRKVRAYEVVRS